MVALALGMDVSVVTIRSDRDSAGHIECGEPVSIEKGAMIRLAGREALRLAGRLDASGELGCRRDIAEAEAAARELADGDQGEAAGLLEELRTRTNTLLRDWPRWREHGAVALALLESETLTGRELRSVLYTTSLHG